MRIRSTKPEFWRSRTIAALDWEARLVLKGLESYVDDNGVGKDSVVLICADVFPHDLASNSGTLARVTRALQNIAEANFLARYVFDGEPLVYVRGWKGIQRIDKPTRGRYPRPDGTMNYDDDVDESIGAGESPIDPEPERPAREPLASPPEDFANPPENCAPGTGEQGNRGTGEKELAPQAPPAPKPERGKHLPENWRPADSTIEWAKTTYPHLDHRHEFEKFSNHWHAASGQNARKRNWDMAFRNWLMNAKSTPNGQGPKVPASDAAFAAAQALKGSPSTDRLEIG